MNKETVKFEMLKIFEDNINYFLDNRYEIEKDSMENIEDWYWTFLEFKGE